MQTKNFFSTFSPEELFSRIACRPLLTTLCFTKDLKSARQSRRVVNVSEAHRKSTNSERTLVLGLSEVGHWDTEEPADDVFDSEKLID